MPASQRGRQAGALIIGLLGAALGALGVYLLVRAFLPGDGAYVMSIVFAPILVLIGVVVVVAARSAWMGSPAGRGAGIAVGAALGLLALYGAGTTLGMFNPGGGAPDDGPPGKVAAGAASLPVAAPVDLVTLGLWLVVAIACLASVILLWRSPATASSRQPG
ncbi:MAG TPA: hypothetical protein VFX74_07810 [Candidatus Limnocylindria bacterium]|jgi:hypothetical protein|nr:hypothetical protein [Candidatus Limnocylindria bacterium]